MKEGLPTNPTKTFTRKKKPFGMREFHFFGTSLKVEAEIEYPEVILDSKLTPRHTRAF